MNYVISLYTILLILKTKKMKLERLNSKNSKFEMFKKDELLSMINIFGGRELDTISGSGSEVNDCFDDSTGKDIKCTDGSTYDLCKVAER